MLELVSNDMSQTPNHDVMTIAALRYLNYCSITHTSGHFRHSVSVGAQMYCKCNSSIHWSYLYFFLTIFFRYIVFYPVWKAYYNFTQIVCAHHVSVCLKLPQYTVPYICTVCFLNKWWIVNKKNSSSIVCRCTWNACLLQNTNSLLFLAEMSAKVKHQQLLFRFK